MRMCKDPTFSQPTNFAKSITILTCYDKTSRENTIVKISVHQFKFDSNSILIPFFDQEQRELSTRALHSTVRS